jgi:hypothetical protein
MFHVAQHREGIKASIGVTGLLWEIDCGGHEWEVVWQGRSRAEAIVAADACPIHATVVRAHTAHVIYDNGKAPGSRVRDQRPDPSIPIRAPRDLRAYRLTA